MENIKMVNLTSRVVHNIEVNISNKYLIRLNQQRCINCKACEVHCKIYKKLPVGIWLGLLFTVGPSMIDGQIGIFSGFRSCFHCENPWCVAVCPTGAIIKRQNDALVMVQSEICVGCKACIEACPWKIPQWDDIRRKVIKCDYCYDLIEKGYNPACISGCTTGALSFERPNRDVGRIRASCAKTMVLRLREKEKTM